MDSFTMPARELAQRIHSGEIGVVEAVQAAIDKAEANRLNAYITIDKEGALMRAEAVQKDIEGGRVASPLAGVPMAIKDNILQKGRMTSCASRMLGDEENPFIAPYDATVVEKLSAIAGCSSYHFQRVFSYMAGVTLGEYIRRRRLTQAAVSLQSTGEKVIDVALRYGYDSPTAFARAFQNFHGMTPTEARKSTGKSFTAYPPISFQISIKGVHKMNYRIEHLDAIRVVGLKLSTTTKDGECYRRIPQFWGEFFQSGQIQSLLPIMNQQPMGVMGISNDDKEGDWQTPHDFDYYIAVASDAPVPAGMEAFTIPPCTWAIFECKGPVPTAVQEMQKRVVTEWLPTSGYEYANAPDIELYTDGDNTSDDFITYIYLPITKK
ncbi:GyrI-like domain-containing protein [Eubacteriales bacterium OttesenSCG-928-M02]|nr:GyrI-like domain-containing protein [Eubacteriales bacterium OttesenSCG-928-M02]